MALAKFHCTNCSKEFEAGNWHCASGESHAVASKVYYVLDAPADRRDCKNARLQILNIVPERQETRGNDIVRIPGEHVEFIRGMFETDNPQLQLGLDKHKGVYSGEEGKKQWEARYFSDSEKAEMDKIRLKGDIQRLEHERNTLLAEVQQRQQKKAS